jgi:hypothetical protein
MLPPIRSLPFTCSPALEIRRWRWTGLLEKPVRWVAKVACKSLAFLWGELRPAAQAAGESALADVHGGRYLVVGETIAGYCPAQVRKDHQRRPLQQVVAEVTLKTNEKSVYRRMSTNETN